MYYPVEIRHDFAYLPVYGYLSAVVRPFFLAHAIPKFSKPPSHPLFVPLSQSTNYYSDNHVFDGRTPLRVKSVSTAPTAEKAQHEPQLP